MVDFEMLACRHREKQDAPFYLKIMYTKDDSKGAKREDDDDAKQNGFFCYGSSFDVDATDLDASLIS